MDRTAPPTDITPDDARRDKAFAAAAGALTRAELACLSVHGMGPVTGLLVASHFQLLRGLIAAPQDWQRRAERRVECACKPRCHEMCKCSCHREEKR